MAQKFTYPAGFVHLPDTVSDEWIKQLVAEQQVIVRSRHGFNARTEWRQLRPRNEALDARVYARAAVWLAGADRWSAFCVSYLAPKNIRSCLALGSSVMLDNGAFTLWRTRRLPNWPRFYAFVEKYQTAKTWAVIPDVIDGEEADNDALIAQWPRELAGAPVWHMHEPVARITRSSRRPDRRAAGPKIHLPRRIRPPRVCIGSSGAYRHLQTARWHDRMTAAMNELCRNGRPPTEFHMLRGMALAGSRYPFTSVDSTDVARNHWRRKNAAAMANRWEARHCPQTWLPVPTQGDLFESRIDQANRQPHQEAAGAE